MAPLPCLSTMPPMRFAITACGVSTVLALGLLGSSYFLKDSPAGQWVDAALYVLLGTLLLAICFPQPRKVLS